MLLVLLAVLQFTTPSRNAATDSTCHAIGSTPLADLARVTLYGVPRGERLVRVLRSKGEVDTGRVDTLTFDDQGRVWSCWVTFSDRGGRESCASNLVGVNLTTAVPDTWRRAREQFFDVTGRRVREPLGPGIFYVRRGRDVRKLVRLQ